MISNFKSTLFYGSSLAFLALNAFFIANEIYWLLALPLALWMLMLFFFSLDKLLMIIVFLTPFTFKFGDEELGFAIILPTEPIIAAIMVLFFLKLFYEQQYDGKILKHPVSVIIILGLIWMFITSITSEIPIVSFKYFLSRLWYVTVFYFVMIQLFRQPEKIRLFFLLFGIALVMIIIYITIKHGTYGFERQAGRWVVRPFFNDHTNYSSVIAMVAPLFLVMSFYRGYSILRRRILLIFFFIFITGIVFSFSRAAWVSLFSSLLVFIVMIFKIDYKVIFASVFIFLGTVFLFQDQIIMTLERNTQDSSGNFREHVRSITNISSDASNLERINRWRAALRMFEERPILGWGPGTYQLVYAPFQLAEDQTIITTNFGDLGNAHSEYLGPLSESGVLGMLSFTFLVLFVFVLGVQNYKRLPRGELKWISLGINLGLFTYFVHGLLNNFLDTDKASVPFWGFIAILVAIDVYYIKKQKSTN
ncbi:MAG: O-antigen ligase family protein [Bacteroidota bacterium]